jgi:hypothetical protein
LRFLGIIEFSDFRFPYTMFTLQASFKPLLLGRWGEGVKSFVKVTVNSKEEKLFLDFCHNYVQEIDLWTGQTACLPFLLQRGGGWMEAAAYTEAEEALSLTESVSRREREVGVGREDFSAVLSQVKN